jgi:hypothetical protein
VRIASTHEITETISTFTFKVEGPDPGFKMPASNDIDAIGRHFLIRSFFLPKVKRHYTVCTCMKKAIYDEYLGAIRQFERGESI